MNSFFNVSSMPNGKTDMNNNGAISTDYIGMNYAYPMSVYAAREHIERGHLEYIQGLIYYLATSPRSPASLRAQVLSWGPCRDEWTETGGYSPQIYVREARRMLSDYMMTQADCQGSRIAPDSICLGSYNMDSHNCQRIVRHGFAYNEGDVQVGVPRPYPISYRSIVPRVGECENLLVTFAIAASHIAFGSTRMEPVFMMASQSAATAAAFAINDHVSVQEVNYAKLALQLTADAQVLSWGGQSASGIIVDDQDAAAVKVGDWSSSTSVAGYWNIGYLHDDNTGKGDKSVMFVPNLPEAGEYGVYLRWTTHANRASSVPVEIIHPAGTNTFFVNQTQDNGSWVHLLTTNFNAGTNGSLRIRTDDTTGDVIADAARWLATSTTANPAVQLIATDPITSESGKTARLLVIRPTLETNSTIQVRYELTGTASNGVDIVALTGDVLMPAGFASTNLVIRAIHDTLSEGDKWLGVALVAGTNYSLGVFSNAVVWVLDTPFDSWRFAHFSETELAATAISGADADPDSDGTTNWQEYLAGTDPRNPASVLRVSIDAQNHAGVISFTASPNQAFTLQYRDSLIKGEWVDLTNISPAESERTVVCADTLPLALASRFYRVRSP